MNSEFGKEVRKALIDRDMKLSTLAEQLGISQPYLTDILKGSRKAIGQRKKICKLLKIEESLFDDYNCKKLRKEKSI